MGRTVPTFRDRLRRFEREWQPYRRGLRRCHQPDFDRLLEHARQHADAAGQQNPRPPEWGIVLSILLAQEIELRQLRERIDTLEESA
ncbi:MAG: hypothetical protein SVG88_07950 [Halobacteriales archaeon]|nr:hypothetical protein [Halobacteriales archaeon]